MSPPDHNRVSDWMQERRLSNSREQADEDLKIRSPSLVGGGMPSGTNPSRPSTKEIWQSWDRNYGSECCLDAS